MTFFPADVLTQAENVLALCQGVAPPDRASAGPMLEPLG